MRPDATISRATTHDGWWRYMNASISATPARSAAAIIVSASAAVSASGFSHRTCLPASAAAIAHGAWRWFGSGMYTASTPGSARSASYEPCARGMACAAATARAASRSREPIATTSQFGAAAMPGITFVRPILAVERTPQRSVAIASASNLVPRSLRRGSAGAPTARSGRVQLLY
jgi:hypothetical protein